MSAEEPKSQILAESPGTCAVVVTFNRRDLLRECLEAILAQTVQVSRILIIDNASSDGTGEMLAADFPAEKYPHIQKIFLTKNLGGAGGFHEGIRRATEDGNVWLWLMDDDTIPKTDALEQLFTARAGFPAIARPELLASKVVWTDGTLHSMNSYWVDQRDPEATFRAAEHGAFPIRTATFVSVLFRSRLVQQFGLPVAEFFIWGDDTEYTGRILRHNLGVAVPRSVVVHKTPRKHASADPSPRFYYHVRNTLWIIRCSRAFSFREKLSQLMQLLRAVSAHFRGGLVDFVRWRLSLSGAWDGLTKTPRSLRR